MIIKYTNFSNGVHELQFSEPASKLGLEEIFVGSVDVDVKMDKSSHQIVINADLKVKIKFNCDRCAKETEQILRSDFVISYLFSKEDTHVDDYNLKVISPEQDKIDITEDVFEYAELAIPMKKLCSEDCNGLCVVCGKNLNETTCNCEIKPVNDVWAPLQQLKDKFNN